MDRQESVKVKILKHNPQNCIDFSIGIEMSKLLRNEEQKLEMVDVTDMNLKVGDVLSMLYLVSTNKITSTATVSFAVNGTLTNMSISNIKRIDCRLCIMLKNPAKLRILQ